MPNIADLFREQPDPNQPGVFADPEFNLEQFLAEADRAVEGSADRQHADSGVSPVEPSPAAATSPGGVPPAGDSSSSPQGEDGTPAGAPVTPPAEPPAAVPSPADPWFSIPPDRRQALLDLDRAMLADPTAGARVAQAIPPPPAAPPALPEGIEEGSPVETLWRQQQEILSELRAQQADRHRQQLDAQQRHTFDAATSALGEFRRRYPQLTHEQVGQIGGRAGSNGLAAAMVARPGYEMTQSFVEALEVELFRDPQLRAQALGQQPPATPTSGIPAAPTDGTVPPPPPGSAPAGEATSHNKRTLHALSGAASPIAGAPPARTPIENRSDGRLTPDSRTALVTEFAKRLEQDRLRGGNNG